MQVDCTLHCVYGAGELYQHTVAGDHEDAAMVLCDQRLKPCCDIYAFAIEVAALDHDIAKIDADTEHNVAIAARVLASSCPVSRL